MRVPTEKLQEFSDREEITPSAQRCLTWIYRKAPSFNQVFIVDLRDFNDWVGRTRVKGAYTPSKLCKIREEIMRLPIIKIKRKLANFVLELAIAPFEKRERRDRILEKSRS